MYDKITSYLSPIIGGLIVACVITLTSLIWELNISKKVAHIAIKKNTESVQHIIQLRVTDQQHLKALVERIISSEKLHVRDTEVMSHLSQVLRELNGSTKDLTLVVNKVLIEFAVLQNKVAHLEREIE